MKASLVFLVLWNLNVHLCADFLKFTTPILIHGIRKKLDVKDVWEYNLYVFSELSRTWQVVVRQHVVEVA